MFVATCDSEIKKVVENYGGKVIMTSDKHLRCTDRIEEAVKNIDADIVVNIQGDEPTVMPKAVMEVALPLVKDELFQCSCLVYPIADKEELHNPNIVKVVISKSNSIMYFSRSQIPYTRDDCRAQFFKQSGIMAFRKKFLPYQFPLFSIICSLESH